ncbi:MAG: triose-phosphate isomerase family protein [bacterium]
MSFLVVANFKSHKNSSEVKSWISVVAPVAQDSPSTIIVAPSFTHLAIDHRPSSIALAAQDVSPFPPGSYTGAINATQLQELDVRYCLVGHSERRHYFHETALDVAAKVKELIEVGITPIICLRKEDLVPDRATLDDGLIASCYFCYEPPSDIGGSVTAPLEDIGNITSQIKQIFNTGKVMYGGSVNADNLTSLLSLGLSGVIISTACLNPVSFNQIIAQLSHVKN